MLIRLSVIGRVPSIEVYRNITSFIVDDTHLRMKSVSHNFTIKKECIIKIRVRD